MEPYKEGIHKFYIKASWFFLVWEKVESDCCGRIDERLLLTNWISSTVIIQQKKSY